MSNNSPYATPKSQLSVVDDSTIYRKKKYAILNPEAEWSSRCFKCNSETEIKKKVKLAYVNPWIYLSILITPILTIILALIFQKKFTLQLPMCNQHVKKRKNFVIFQWVTTILSIVGISVGIATDSPLILVSAIVLFLVVVISAIAGRILYAAKYKDNRIWVRGAGKEFLESLPNFQN